MSFLDIFKKKSKKEEENVKVNNIPDVSINDDSSDTVVQTIEPITTDNVITTNEIIQTEEATDENVKPSEEKKQYTKKTNQNVRPQPPNTVYNTVSKIRKEDFSRKDLRKISNIIRDKFKKQFGEETEPEKVTQTEGNNTYEVFCYPEVMRKEIARIVVWFFNIKETRATKHQRLIKTETLSKLKKTASPDYEMELVKFNMAEEERRKNEKIKKAQELKEQKFKGKKPFNNKFASNNNNRTNYNPANKPFNKRKFNPNEAGQKQDGTTTTFKRRDNNLRPRTNFNKTQTQNNNTTNINEKK